MSLELCQKKAVEINEILNRLMKLRLTTLQAVLLYLELT